MRAVDAAIENRGTSPAFLDGLAARFSRSLVRLLGCWHTDMGRPITLGGETYRACLDCGARRRFDTDDWRMRGPYYY